MNMYLNRCFACVPRQGCRGIRPARAMARTAKVGGQAPKQPVAPAPEVPEVKAASAKLRKPLKGPAAPAAASSAEGIKGKGNQKKYHQTRLGVAMEALKKAVKEAHAAIDDEAKRIKDRKRKVLYRSGIRRTPDQHKKTDADDDAERDAFS